MKTVAFQPLWRAAVLGVLGLGALTSALPAENHIASWRSVLFTLLPVAAYLHGRRLPVRTAPVFAGLAALTVAIMFVRFWPGFTALLTLGVLIALPWLAGSFRRQQAELVLASQREVEQLRRESEYVAERAKQRERARIATDMHDQLGHELALIALRAGGLELSQKLDDSARQTASQLRASAVSATDRLRETIDMLRQDGPEVEMPRESLSALVERAGEAGMDVRLESQFPALPPLLERAVHRVIQEALTNAARYAPGAVVRVESGTSDEEMWVTVRNSASAAESGLTGSGGGLEGLAERVRLLGGTFRAGPDEGGFEVTAIFPWSAT